MAKGTPKAKKSVENDLQVSSHQETAQRLQESKSHYQSLEELAQAGKWEYNVRTKEFVRSDGTYRLFGMRENERVTPDVYLEYAVNDDLLLAKKTVDAIRENFEPIDVSMRIEFR